MPPAERSTIGVLSSILTLLMPMRAVPPPLLASMPCRYAAGAGGAYVPHPLRRRLAQVLDVHPGEQLARLHLEPAGTPRGESFNSRCRCSLHPALPMSAHHPRVHATHTQVSPRANRRTSSPRRCAWGTCASTSAPTARRAAAATRPTTRRPSGSATTGGRSGGARPRRCRCANRM